jgi:dTDP-L-rhamnose 4-epimerase
MCSPSAGGPETSTILVTGGGGFIGCALAERLVLQGHRVVVLDSFHGRVHAGRTRSERLPAEAAVIVGDVADADAWAEVFDHAAPDNLVHLAAETCASRSLAEAPRHSLVNVVGTSRMIEALMRSGARGVHLVLASSRAVYGEGRWQADGGTFFYPRFRRPQDLARGRWDPRSPRGRARPVPSDPDVNLTLPTTVYGTTKEAQEHECGSWAAATGAKVSVLRLQNVYGPGQSLTDRCAGVLTVFARTAAARQAIQLHEDGRVRRDFVHVEDVVDALVAALDSPPPMLRTVDIGSGTLTTLHEAATLLAEMARAPAPIVTGRSRIGDVRAAWCCPDQARFQLGFQASTPFEKGLSELMAYVRSSTRPV